MPVLKNIAVIPLLIAFAAQSFSGAFIQLGYAINPAAFAKYCVNKAKPKLQCNGKCQMMKKLREEEKKEQQNAEQRSELKVQVLSSHSSFCSIPSANFLTVRKIYFERKYPLSDISYAFFHPPQA